MKTMNANLKKENRPTKLDLLNESIKRIQVKQDKLKKEYDDMDPHAYSDLAFNAGRRHALSEAEIVMYGVMAEYQSKNN